MALVTIQLIEGLERGRVYSDLPTPITIGREDDNEIQLNDERVSRFHVKIQEDGGRLILTDLDSTNGTRVNGHPVQMRVLQPGDQISIGRCLLVFGSRDDISERLADFQKGAEGPSQPVNHTIASSGDFLDDPATSQVGPLDDQSGGIGADPDQLKLFPEGAPDPPSGLRPVQRAEFSDYLAYIHEQIRRVLQAGYEDPNDYREETKSTCVDWPAWQHLLQLEMELSIYLRKIAEPDD